MQTALFVTISIIVFLECSNADELNPKLLKRAKRMFQQKERQYAKEKGISRELKSFIDSHRNQEASDRVKRGELEKLDKSHMYIIKDGEVMPLTDVNIPEISIITNPTVASDLGVTGGPGGSTKCYKKGEENNSTGRLAEDFTVLPLVVPLGADIYRNGGGGGGNSHDDMIIDRIMDDVENLEKIKHSKSWKHGIDGASCNVSGAWISTAGGMELTIPQIDQNMTGRVELKRTVSPIMTSGFLSEGDWSMICQTPFQHSSMVLLVATRKEGKKIATFIGECRVCGTSEVISGDWMIGRSSTDCRDQKASHAMLSDVFRKDNVDMLHDHHLSELIRPTHIPDNL
ncbi:unnamed protein product [Brassicogethes aeneus]|uniref:Uncharacterized protein n=1 Tax=Brassicogethes aeneus TaxID=1431903 RepID=A0A9P0AQ79_BRAAE|nr:unnamed protein product [Brassicogethes aeneus]